ncbi:MAG: ATP-binding protein [Planctomycetota bacterium]
MWDENLGPLFDVLPVGVLVLDSEGQLLDANRMGLESLGLEERAVGRLRLGEYVKDSSLKRALAVPADCVFRLDFTEKERTYHAEVRPLPASNNGKKLLLLSDVSVVSGVALARKRLVFDLLHMLRTPLTPIVSVLRMTATGKLDPSQVDIRELLSMGEREASRLSNLLTKLKDLALVETGLLEEEIALEPVPIQELLARVVERFRPLMEEKGQTIVESYPSEPVHALADREVLPRVFRMLIENAHRYSPEGATVTLGLSAGKAYVQLEIADDGPGIPADELPRAFELFRRGESAYARDVEGGSRVHPPRRHRVADPLRGAARPRRAAAPEGAASGAEPRCGGSREHGPRGPHRGDRSREPQPCALAPRTVDGPAAPPPRDGGEDSALAGRLRRRGSGR